jgi:hypothetical protein
MTRRGLLEQIERAKAELQTVKPRSRRRIELELRLRNLVTDLLRKENCISRRTKAVIAPTVAPSDPADQVDASIDDIGAALRAIGEQEAA